MVNDGTKPAATSPRPREKFGHDRVSSGGGGIPDALGKRVRLGQDPRQSVIPAHTGKPR